MPFWDLLRESRREGSFIKFFGVPTFLFDELALRMKEKLPLAYDRTVVMRGRRPVFDYVDMTALAIRRLRVASVKSLEVMCSDFGRNRSVVSRSLIEATGALFAVLREAPSAAVRYPILAEVRKMVAGKKAELGERGTYGLAARTVLMGDGTATPATKDAVRRSRAPVPSTSAASGPRASRPPLRPAFPPWQRPSVR